MGQEALLKEREEAMLAERKRKFGASWTFFRSYKRSHKAGACHAEKSSRLPVVATAASLGSCVQIEQLLRASVSVLIVC